MSQVSCSSLAASMMGMVTSGDAQVTLTGVAAIVSMARSGDLDDPAPRHLDEIAGGQTKGRVGRPGGGPDLGELEQVLIDEGLEGVGVAERRHPADGKAGVLANEGGPRLLQRLLQQRA